jgi:hypothetical protein
MPFNNDSLKFGFNYKDGIIFKIIGEQSMNSIDDVTGYGGTSYQNIDNLNGAGRTWGTRIEPIFGTSKGAKEKLSGFVITDMEGKTYYYTMPIFTWGQLSYTTDKEISPENGNFLVRHGKSVIGMKIHLML